MVIFVICISITCLFACCFAELIDLMREQRVDLLIIEGMGRALHTNFAVPFACDTLKLAVVKNAWWAKRLGGANFAVICKFEPHRGGPTTTARAGCN